MSKGKVKRRIEAAIADLARTAPLLAEIGRRTSKKIHDACAKLAALMAVSRTERLVLAGVPTEKIIGGCCEPGGLRHF